MLQPYEHTIKNTKRHSKTAEEQTTPQGHHKETKRTTNEHQTENENDSEGHQMLQIHTNRTTNKYQADTK